MIKHKPCKGQSKAAGFKGCGKMVNAVTRRFGLCFNCYPKFILETDVGKVLMQKAILKASKPRTEFEQAVKQDKENNTVKTLIKSTQLVFNKYIRLRDKGKPCISSNEPWRPDFDAGHFYSVKQYNSLRFDEDNVHGQSIGDNRFKEGNFSDYSIYLIDRIGKERYDELLKRAEESKRNIKQWTVWELQEIKEKYLSKIKDIINI